MNPVLYLYALVDEEPAGALGEGIAGEPLRLVPFGGMGGVGGVGGIGGIAAVAGELAGRPRPDRETLQTQDAVVRRLAERFGALLPARFGEAFADERALAERIASRARDLAVALALVRGCVQMTLRVFGDGTPEPAAEAGLEPGGGTGTRFLAARRRERERARSLPEIEPLREALRPLLRAERIERHTAAGRLLGTAYHLVLRSQTGAYLAALEGARGRIGDCRVAATGPWPPYAFAPGAAP